MSKLRRKDREKGWRLEGWEVRWSVHGGWYAMITEVSDRGGSSKFPLWDIQNKVLFETPERANEVVAKWLKSYN